MAKTNNLKDFLTDIADTIRAKKGTTALINPQDFSNEIASIEGGGTSNVYTYQDRIDETKDCSSLFRSYTGTNDIAKGLNTAGVTSMLNMFDGCNNVTSLDLSSFNTSDVTNMNYMFKDCSKLTSLDVSSFDTSNVNGMSYMFNHCVSLVNLNLSSFNTSKVTQTSSMFANASKLETILGVLDLIKISSNSSMFTNCKALTNVTLKNIKKSLQLGSGTSYGHLLSLDSLINAVKELWDYSSGTTTYTLTLSTASKTALANVYVKLITPTEEQIAQDPNIVNKKPCEVCQSTDEGAMLITDYATLKKWNIV